MERRDGLRLLIVSFLSLLVMEGEGGLGSTYLLILTVILDICLSLL